MRDAPGYPTYEPHQPFGNSALSPTRRMPLGRSQDVPELLPGDGSALGFDIT
jgi:hypothetical protein